jgi:hypothetical protein
MAMSIDKIFGKNPQGRVFVDELLSKLDKLPPEIKCECGNSACKAQFSVYAWPWPDDQFYNFYCGISQKPSRKRKTMMTIDLKIKEHILAYKTIGKEIPAFRITIQECKELFQYIKDYEILPESNLQWDDIKMYRQVEIEVVVKIN